MKSLIIFLSFLILQNIYAEEKTAYLFWKQSLFQVHLMILTWSKFGLTDM